MMHRTWVFSALLLLPLVVLSGCGSDDATAPAGVPTTLEIQGQVVSDAWDEPLQVPVHLRIFRPDGRGGWSEGEAGPTGSFSLEVELRDGCEPGQTLEAAAWITAPDHRSVQEDLGRGRSVLCDPGPQTLNYSLFREIFRTPVPVAGELRASQVSGFHWTCAVPDQGTYCWGVDDPAPVPVAGGGSFQVVEAGFQHACALDAEGAAWCWGANGNGVLGVAGMDESAQPVQVQTDLRFVALAANAESTCGLDEEGRLYCWGMYGGETPEPFAGDLRFRQVSGQWTHMCGVEEGTGRVHCWGDNVLGELGREERGRAEEPVLVAGMEGAELVETSARFTCALDQAGSLYCWGWNCDGQLGRAGPPADNPVPQIVEGAPPLASISLGYGFTCGLTGDGEAWCWGLNSRGQLGSEAERGIRSVDPLRVSGDYRFASLGAGFRSACGVTPEGELYCWGDRRYLGTGLTPEPVQAGARAAAGTSRPWAAGPMSAPSVPAGGTCS